MATDYILQTLELRHADLERKLAARDGQALYADNVKELKDALAQLNAEIAARKATS